MLFNREGSEGSDTGKVVREDSYTYLVNERGHFIPVVTYITFKTIHCPLLR